MFPSRRITTSGGDKFRDEFSLAFDGANDHVLTGFKPDYIHTNATFAMWVKMGDFIGQQTMGSHSSKRWYLGFSGSKGFLGVANANRDDITITPTPVAGQWLHYAVTAIDGTATLYINGVAMADTLSYTQASATNPTDGFTIASRNNGGTMQNAMNANISEVVQYDKGLSASEIKTLYNGREPYNHKEGICSSNLKAWWRMGDGRFDDFSGSGNGLVTDTEDESIGTDLNSTANATSISNESNGTAGGWINGNGSGSNQMATYESSTSNVVNGTYSLHATADNDNDRVYYSFTTVVGKCYQVKLPITITNHHTSDANLRIRCGDAQNGTDHYDLSSYAINPTTGTFEYKTAFIATATTTFLTLRENGGNNNVDFYIDSLSIKELSGNAGVMINLGNNFEGDTP